MKQFDFNNAVWSNPQKILYRTNCIINPFRDVFHINNMPSNRYYWSICGTNTKKGVLDKNSEIGQISQHLINIPQFVGVDRSPVIIAENDAVWPQAHWFVGEFSEVIHRLANKYVPMIIHLDTIVMLGKAETAIADIISLVEYLDVPMMVVLNTTVKRWLDKSPQDPKNLISNIVTLNEGWEIRDLVYEYKGGLTTSRVIMAAFMLFYRTH